MSHYTFGSLLKVKPKKVNDLKKHLNLKTTKFYKDSEFILTGLNYDFNKEQWIYVLENGYYNWTVEAQFIELFMDFIVVANPATTNFDLNRGMIVKNDSLNGIFMLSENRKFIYELME